MTKMIPNDRARLAEELFKAVSIKELLKARNELTPYTVGMFIEDINNISDEFFTAIEKRGWMVPEAIPVVWPDPVDDLTAGEKLVRMAAAEPLDGQNASAMYSPPHSDDERLELLLNRSGVTFRSKI